MQPSNGPQGQFGFAGEQGNNVNGMYPATPAQNNYHNNMRQPITYGNAQTQQGRPRDQPQFIGQQQVVNFNGIPHTLPMRNHPVATMNFAQGNTQHGHQIPRSQPRLVNQQMINAGGWSSEMAHGNNPHTMDANPQFYTPMGQQPGQFQNIQNDQRAQVYQSTEEYQFGQNYQHGQNQRHGHNQQYGQSYQPAQRYHNSPGSNNYQNNQRGVPNPAAHGRQPGAGLPPQAGRADMALQAAINAQRAAVTASRAANNAPRAATASHSTTNPHQAVINAPRAVSAPRAAATTSRATINAPRVAPAPQLAILPQAASPAQAGLSPNAGSHSAWAPEVRAAEPHESSMGTEVTDDIQEEVNLLIKEKATTFKGHIKSPKDVARYKQAVWKARLRGGSNHEKKCADYPKDEAGEMTIIGRIFDAIVNVGGEQDPASESGDLANCLAVKTIKGLTGIEVEFLAHDFLVSTITASILCEMLVLI